MMMSPLVWLSTRRPVDEWVKIRCGPQPCRRSDRNATTAVQSEERSVGRTMNSVSDEVAAATRSGLNLRRVLDFTVSNMVENVLSIGVLHAYVGA